MESGESKRRFSFRPPLEQDLSEQEQEKVYQETLQLFASEIERGEFDVAIEGERFCLKPLDIRSGVDLLKKEDAHIETVFKYCSLRRGFFLRPELAAYLKIGECRNVCRLISKGFNRLMLWIEIEHFSLGNLSLFRSFPCTWLIPGNPRVLNPVVTQRVAIDISISIKDTHAVGVCSRDVRADNIMTGDDGGFNQSDWDNSGIEDHEGQTMTSLVGCGVANLALAELAKDAVQIQKYQYRTKFPYKIAIMDWPHLAVVLAECFGMEPIEGSWKKTIETVYLTEKNIAFLSQPTPTDTRGLTQEQHCLKYELLRLELVLLRFIQLCLASDEPKIHSYMENELVPSLVHITEYDRIFSSVREEQAKVIVRAWALMRKVKPHGVMLQKITKALRFTEPEMIKAMNNPTPEFLHRVLDIPGSPEAKIRRLVEFVSILRQAHVTFSARTEEYLAIYRGMAAQEPATHTTTSAARDLTPKQDEAIQLTTTAPLASNSMPKPPSILAQLNAAPANTTKSTQAFAPTGVAPPDATVNSTEPEAESMEIFSDAESPPTTPRKRENKAKAAEAATPSNHLTHDELPAQAKGCIDTTLVAIKLHLSNLTKKKDQSIYTGEELPFERFRKCKFCPTIILLPRSGSIGRSYRTEANNKLQDLNLDTTFRASSSENAVWCGVCRKLL